MSYANMKPFKFRIAKFSAFRRLHKYQEIVVLCDNTAQNTDIWKHLCSSLAVLLIMQGVGLYFYFIIDIGNFGELAGKKSQNVERQNVTNVERQNVTLRARLS